MRRAALLVVLTLVYFAAGRLGLSLAVVHQSASGVWLPSGIALAACLIAGVRVWPAIFVGAFLVNLTTSHALVPSLLIAVGNSLEAVVGAWLVRRFAGGTATFGTAPGILAFAGSVLVAATLAATVGVVALQVWRLATPQAAWVIWSTWWLGDVTGALILTPAIIFWMQEPLSGWTWRKSAEAILALAFVVTTAYFVFAGSTAAHNLPLAFLLFPCLLWVALRFGPRETTTAIILVSAIAVQGTIVRAGPFGRSGTAESMLLLQAFLAVSAIANLSLAAESSRRRATETQVRQMNAELAARVDARTEELQRLHGRLVEAQHVAKVGSWEWDITGNSVWWSDELYTIYDLPSGAPVAYETFLSLVHPDDRHMVHTTVQQSATTLEPFAYEHRIVRPDQTVRIVSAHGRIVTDKDGRPVRMMGIAHDITDRKQAEEERLQLLREQAARREAEESSRMKDQFLATLSHELRTPLNAVLGWAQILRESPHDERMRGRAIDAIMRNVEVQAQLVSDILDVARIRSGTLRLEPKPLVLTDVITSALDIVRPMMMSKDIEVTVSVAPEADGIVGDGQRLQQVFWNLLSNAAKFTPARGHVSVTAIASAGTIAVTVEDDGPGIEESFLPHVFEQFRQADGSVTREYGGLGLGLAISHHLVELHHGEITAANRPAGGASFTVRLPAPGLAT